MAKYLVQGVQLPLDKPVMTFRSYSRQHIPFTQFSLFKRAPIFPVPVVPF